jgi:hypothetical protein
MRQRVIPVVILLIAGVLASAEAPHGTATLFEADPHRLVVHEWGTFTSVAGADGAAVEWTPLVAPPDLPCFVDKVQFESKGWIPGTVRMETPVLYFYASQDMTVDVRVRFRQGVVTEWYPRADVAPMKIQPETIRKPDLVGTLAWTGVRVLPKATEAFPVEPGESHYYAARATDAAPLQVGTQHEKLLFYRGVGMFPPPLNAGIHDDGDVAIQASTGSPVGDVIVFENRGGVVSYQALRVNARNVKLALPASPSSVRTLGAHLVRLLVSNGLFKREAEAMVETWRDSWFEEGTRLLYIVPPASVDEILPLRVTPSPERVARVFVGRLEVFTPATLGEVERAIRATDIKTLIKYGRFVDPIVGVIQAKGGLSSEGDERRIEAALRLVAAADTPEVVCKSQ